VVECPVISPGMEVTSSTEEEEEEVVYGLLISRDRHITTPRVLARLLRSTSAPSCCRTP